MPDEPTPQSRSDEALALARSQSDSDLTAVRSPHSISRTHFQVVREQLAAHGVTISHPLDLIERGVRDLEEQHQALREVCEHAVGNLRRHGLEQSARYIEEQLNGV